MLSDACALAAPVGDDETLIQATGFWYISPPPTVQSSRFLKLPGRAPAYSGVLISTACAWAIAARKAATGSGNGSWSSSGLKCGSAVMPSKRVVVTPSGATTCAVRSSAVLVEAPRVLPESRRILILTRTPAGVPQIRTGAAAPLSTADRRSSNGDGTDPTPARDGGGDDNAACRRGRPPADVRGPPDASRERSGVPGGADDRSALPARVQRLPPPTPSAWSVRRLSKVVSNERSFQHPPQHCVLALP